MRLCQPSYEIWEQPAGLEGIYKMIEKAGRVCYRSEDKITEDSAKSFVDRMVASGHGAMLEHGTVYLRTFSNYDREVYERYKNNPYSRVEVIGSIEGTNDTLDGYYITTNYRVLVENNWLDDLKYLCEPTEYHAKRITVHFILSRSIAQEYTRHRVFSFAQESTRYCNYSKDKFNGEITYILPCWMNELKEGYYDLDWDVVNSEGESVSYPYPEDARAVSFWYKHTDNDKSIHLTAEDPRDLYLSGLWECEEIYFKLLSFGWKPQQAREVLPNALKTELVMTGFADDWKHFFLLRCPVNAHPQARELAIPLSDEFNRRGYLK